jgi:L-ascorbate metabolism protein UlaG (beta-lactamase superfamily)
MKIRLISHASVILSCTDTQLWTDPWLISKAFNDSWTLLPPAEFSESLLEKIDYLWLSHEHPDHLNFPTLASLPAEFKERVNLVFQDNNAERIFEPLRKLGYRRFSVLPHRRTIALTSQTRVYCYRVGTLDSCLAVLNGGQTVLNLNDARLNTADCALILKDIGPIDAILNQFSIAVKEPVIGYEEHAVAAARSVLQSMSADHRRLGAKVTIPFASFMYFSAVDNKQMNVFSNTPRDSYEFLKNRGQQVAPLYPGDEYAVNEAHDHDRALTRYNELYSRFDSLTYDVPPKVPFSQIVQTFHVLVRNLRNKYSLPLLRRLRPLRIRIPDLDITVDVNISSDSITECGSAEQPDAIVYSQPLNYCFARTWGMGTLTISGRFVLLRNAYNWKIHKALFALNDAGVYLRPRYLFSRHNWTYLKDLLNARQRYTRRTLSSERPIVTEPATRVQI